MTSSSPAAKPRFCSECGTPFLPDAKFCHNCGVAVGGHGTNTASAATISPLLKWGVPAAALLALVVLSLVRMNGPAAVPASAGATPLAAGGGVAPPDISSMTPEERADRLFNRVMRLWSDGKTDSAAFFAPMAISAFEELSPLTAHSRYDLGLVALVSGDIAKAAAQSDTILKARPTHLLGLVLAARVADARGDVTAAKAVRQRLLAAEKSERANPLPEYNDHDADLRAAIELARKG
jgi:hypothetical protein